MAAKAKVVLRRILGHIKSVQKDTIKECLKNETEHGWKLKFKHVPFISMLASDGALVLCLVQLNVSPIIEKELVLAMWMTGPPVTTRPRSQPWNHWNWTPG